ncbi:UDP-3-O-[3-hydroxymyristoyl] glucosamine N-acyltransferase [bacterium BMS3Abin03]|nr:UDP-3-O-[3-hydroxymyristoyl] glucosamine N-acyltransferase [bacterium BMS3Abin03]
MHICIFEDDKYSNFYPLTLSRPVYDLVCGVRSLKEKILAEFEEADISLHCRKYLEQATRSGNPNFKINSITGDECVFINGRIALSSDVKNLVANIGDEDIVYKNGDTVILAKLSGENLSKIKAHLPDAITADLLDGIFSVETDAECYNYLWEMIANNGPEIVNDIEHLRKTGYFITHLDDFAGVNFVNPDKIFIRQNVTIKPGVVIDASKGAVLLDEDAFIFPNAVIEGPAYIGKSSKIKSGATIYENVSIGSVCKIGGEVEDTIVLPHSNKQHSGFIGHAYLGSWVNLGADTNCSDLKNNYSTIKVTLNGYTIDTGSQFLGVIIGDHSKSAINTMFNTGTIIGFSCNIFGAGFPDKYIPSFSWGGSDGITTYDLSKSIQTAKVVLSRRNKKFTTEDEKLFEDIFNLTKEERNG